MTSFDDFIGNSAIKKAFTTALKKERLGQSYLFFGPEGVGKKQFALYLAEILLSDGTNLQKIRSGSHPDLRVYAPEGKIAMHSIDSLRRLTDEVHLSPFEASRKVFIIDDAERMLPTSSNALLKTLEEPSAHTTIILISSATERLLPTILSRCQRVRFEPISDSEMTSWFEKNAPDKIALASQAQGSLSKAKELLNQQGDPIRATLYNAFSKGTLESYSSLKSLSKELASKIQTRKEELLDEAKDKLANPLEELSAKNRDAMQKEMDGFVAREMFHSIDRLFTSIIDWFRDCQVVRLNGNGVLLRNPDSIQALGTYVQNRTLPEIEKVLEICRETKLSLERSSPLEPTLEALFLRLGFSKRE